MQIGNDWLFDLNTAMDTARQQRKWILLQFHRDECAGCKKLYATTYADEDVRRELFEWFIPLRQDIIKNRAVRSQFSAYWTPSFFFINTRGNTLYSFNGYLNVEDFRVLLRLGKAALEIPRGKYYHVIDLMDDGLEKFPSNPRAAAMLFTRGMAEYLLGKEKNRLQRSNDRNCCTIPAQPGSLHVALARPTVICNYKENRYVRVN